LGGVLAVLAVLLVVVIYLGVVPPNLQTLASHPHPAIDYADAVKRVEAAQAQEAGRLKPECMTQLLTHGQKTTRVVAFAHGYTNCPKQFLALGQKFYDLGYNVLLMPIPHHGLTDRLTDDLTNLTAEELVAYADQVIDIEQGLGDYRVFAGLSGAGNVAGWAAQTRADLDQAVMIEPIFEVQEIPRPATVLAVNVVLMMPDTFSWWDPRHPDTGTGGTMSHAYPRFSLHGLAQCIRLGFAARALASKAAPAAGSMLLVTNAADLGGTTAASEELLALWRAHGAAKVESYEYPAQLKLAHDMIDPGQHDQQVEVVYPKLVELINQ
jgi:carboxylesterase